MTTPTSPFPRTVTILGAVIAVSYGVLIRAVADNKLFSDLMVVMSVAFISLVPMVVGFLAVRPIERPSWKLALLYPWAPTLMVAVIAGIIGYEGAICLIMALPIMLVAGSIGGVVALVLDRRRARGAGVTAAVVALPLLFSLVERRIPEAYQYRIVENTIGIQASRHTVWREIVSLAAFLPVEIARE